MRVMTEALSIDAIAGLLLIITPLILLGLFRKNVLSTSIITLALGSILAISQAKTPVLVSSLYNGAWTGVQISLLILAAIFFYVNYISLGYLDSLRRNIKPGKGTELYLAVFFSGYIESMSGYGVSPAVTAPILLNLGTTALMATTLPMFGHAWAVPFASLGVPTLVLSGVTGVDARPLAMETAHLLTIPLALTVITIGLMVRPSFKAFSIALLLAFSTYIFAGAGLYTAILLGLTGFTVGILITQGFSPTVSVIKGLLPYLLLSVIVIVLSIIGLRGLVWVTLSTILTATLLAFWNRVGILDKVRRAVKMTRNTLLSIVAFSVIAELSKQAGYAISLARLIASLSGNWYTVIVPFVALIGSFITGSATNSNFLLGALQMAYSDFAGIDPVFVLTLQNAGAGLGSGLAPAKIAIAASTTGGSKIESEVFRRSALMILLLVLSLTITAVLRIL
ncbi:MAG: L-lactate permease [Infirmifilum sp.]|jgi:lactate permease|uniref:L-lactate permease n=1 Tax=Infirmifilum sp. TaxID=2856575 RepID=UPI003D0FFAFD